MLAFAGKVSPIHRVHSGRSLVTDQKVATKTLSPLNLSNSPGLDSSVKASLADQARSVLRPVKGPRVADQIGRANNFSSSPGPGVRTGLVLGSDQNLSRKVLNPVAVSTLNRNSSSDLNSILNFVKRPTVSIRVPVVLNLALRGIISDAFRSLAGSSSPSEADLASALKPKSVSRNCCN